MTEVSSRWLLQELFVDPFFSGSLEGGEINLKVSSDVIDKVDGRVRVAVEISGSVILGGTQVANFRFANVTEVEGSVRRKKNLLKRVEERRKSELLAFLPVYLLRAGIVLKELRVGL